MKYKQLTTSLTAALCVASLSGTVAAVDGPVFTGIGDLPGGTFSSSAEAVSGDGKTVVGWGHSEAGWEAIRWRWDDGIEGLGDLPGGVFYSIAKAVSEDGSVVVGTSYSTFRSEDGPSWAGREAFRWTEEEGMVGLGDLPDEPFGSIARDVSANGRVIAGTGNDATLDGGDTPWGSGASEAFLWSVETGMFGLGDLPGTPRKSAAFGVSGDGTVVVGYREEPEEVQISTVEEAFRWTEEEGMVGLGDLAGAYFFSAALAVSADGDTVVGQSRSEFGSEAFRWTEATGMVGLGDLPGGYFSSAATGASGDGAVIVGNGNSDLGPEPFVWTEPQGMRRLADVLDDHDVDLGEWVLQRAWGVSDDGLVIVGRGINPEGNPEGWVACLRDECFEDDDDDDDHGDEGHQHHGDKGEGHHEHGDKGKRHRHNDDDDD